jgi:hypothetical protein
MTTPASVTSSRSTSSQRGCVCRRTSRNWQPDGVCAACGQRVLESQLTPVLLQILCGGTGLVLWRNTRGFDAERQIKYGVGDGGADYIGLWSPSGRFVGVEFKTPHGRQQQNQVTWQTLVERLGGVYAIVRSPDDAHALLTRLRAEVPA